MICEFMLFSPCSVQQAFGVGALEEEDDDIYSHENIVDFSATEASDADISAEQVFGWTGGMQGG